MKPTTLYGIPNCDTVKKARTWLDAHGDAYTFHDYKKQGVDPAKLRGWVDRLGWETVLNRAGTTFRALPDADKTALDADKAVGLMLASPSMIKRPILETGDTLLAGFKPDAYLAALHNLKDRKMPTATWNGATLAQSDDTVIVEGNHYFPADSITPDYFEDSATHTTCPWKGVASYKSVVVDGKRNADAAWYYPDPKPKAAEIKDRFAFWKGVTVS